MPFVDLDTFAGDPVKGKFDVTVIGAGAAGILLAVKLTKAGKKVLVIESGHFFIDEEKQRLNEVENGGKEVKNIVWGRKRAIGGTTLAWGGQSLPFTPLDFSTRPWVQNSGWPVSAKELDGFYKEANRFMGIDELNYDTDIFHKIKLHNPGLDKSLLDFHVSKWARQPDFRKKYNDFLEEHVTILYNAHALNIQRDEQGSAKKIEIQNFKNRVYSIDVKKLVIAAGTVESIRLLLNNNIGTESGMLGKCFMEHPCIKLGEVIPANEYHFQKYFNTHTRNKSKYSVRLSLSENMQIRRELLNCSAGFMFEPKKDKFDPYAEILALKKKMNVKGIFRLLKVSGKLSRSAAAYIKDRFFYKINADISLVLMTEQEPLLHSNISVSKCRDEFNVPKAKVTWDISLSTWKTVTEMAMIIKNEIARLKLGTVQLYDHIYMDNPRWADYLSDVNHHMGGCRMSSIPETGVVDKDLKVWGSSNIYVCSCAVFPTSSHSNPTLTMLALGIKLTELLSVNKS